MLKKAGSTDTEKMVDAMEGLRIAGVFGSYEWRKIDHQSTLGAFVGKTAIKGDRGIMTDWRYADGAKYLPPDAVVKQMRPG
jgi:branched-chain amino acid transport system substrate-binding protein